MIKLSQNLLLDIKRHAQRIYPEECCGALFGIEKEGVKEVTSIRELTNTNIIQRKRRYLISPEDYRTVETEASRQGVEIVGLYHSHPDHPSRPSAFDLEHALPNWSYIIISVEQGQSKLVSSWVLKDDRSAFDEERITVVERKFVSQQRY